MVHSKSLLLLVLLCLLLPSCLLTSPESSDISQIKDLLYDISVSFNFKNVYPIMNLVHNDFLHDGLNPFTLRELWLNRMAEYQLLSIENIEVVVNGDYATASFRMVFEATGSTVTYMAPAELGDASFFYYHRGSWKLYGNQRY